MDRETQARKENFYGLVMVIFLIIGAVVLANSCTPDKPTYTSSVGTGSGTIQITPTTGPQGASSEAVDHLLRTFVTDGRKRAPDDRRPHFEMDKP